MNAVEVLQAAKNELIKNGWIKDSYEDEGKHCIVGAIGKIKGLLPNALLNAEYSREVSFFKDAIDIPNVIAWNDTEGRTFADVMDAFDKAILYAKEEEGTS